MSDYEQAVFISYAWGDEREEIVDQLDQALQARGLKIIRDKRELGYKGSISAFMERIGQGNCVIVVISDKYLRSPNCMFELVEIAKNKDFYDRVFPIVLADADIYKPVNRIKYIKYWEDQLKELDEAMKTVSSANLQGVREEIDSYDEIRDNISNLAFLLKDMNTLTLEMHRDSNFSQLFDALALRMQSARAGTSAKSTSHPKKERRPMDPITLATAATALLAPYLSKVGEKALEKIGEQLPDKVGAVWNAISNRFFKNKPLVAAAASDFANNPEDTDNQESFNRELRKALKDLKDEDFAGQLTDLIDQAKSDPSINIGGDGVVANNNSVAVGKISVGGNVNGNFVIGNNNQVSNNK